jgi:hypothetical protein
VHELFREVDVASAQMLYLDTPHRCIRRNDSGAVDVFPPGARRGGVEQSMALRTSGSTRSARRSTRWTPPGARRRAATPPTASPLTTENPGCASEIAMTVDVRDGLTSQSRHSLVLAGSPPSARLVVPLTSEPAVSRRASRTESGLSTRISGETSHLSERVGSPRAKPLDPTRSERAASERASRTECDLAKCTSREPSRTSERVGDLGTEPLDPSGKRAAGQAASLANEPRLA